jgi:hypothetical protein
MDILLGFDALDKSELEFEAELVEGQEKALKGGRRGSKQSQDGHRVQPSLMERGDRQLNRRLS